MRVSCRATTKLLPSIMDGRVPPGPAGRHLGTCLQCQAEAARYRTMSRQLRSLADVEVEAPSWLAPTVMEELDYRKLPEPVVASRTPERVALAGTAVAVAGVIAVLGWRRFHAAS